MNGKYDINHVASNWGWFLIGGILMVILGIIAISVSTLTTMVSVLLLGVLILLGGIILLFDTFKFWWQHWGGFFLFLLMGILYVIVGFMLIKYPVAGAVSLTLLLAIFFIIVGLLRIIGSISTQLPQWGWVLFSGIVTFILGIMILMQWPTSGLYILGLFIGIELILAGWAYILLSLAARSHVRHEHGSPT